MIAAVGGALELPKADLAQFADTASHLRLDSTAALQSNLGRCAEWRAKLKTPPWRVLIDFVLQLICAPKALVQHVGGVALSGKLLSNLLPTRKSAIDRRRVMDWDKYNAHDAGFAKIDILSLLVLDRLEETLNWIKRREGNRPNLYQIDPEDPGATI